METLSYCQLMQRCGELEAQVKQLTAERDAVVAENVMLKSGAAYFSYGSEYSFEWHNTQHDAVEAAEAAIDDYRGEACDGWSEEVDTVCWGVIMQSSTKIDERPRNEDDCCDPSIDTVCDYALLPNIETPATDDILASLRAEGVNELCKAFVLHKDQAGLDDDDLVTVREATDAVLHCAEQLRSQSEQVKGAV